MIEAPRSHASDDDPRPDRPLFELRDVSFSVDGKALPQPLTMSISARQMTALVGHNGSGKSTLLKILARQQRATTGSVSLEGRVLSVWLDRLLAQKVAYLPQQTPPANGMLVKELVSLGRYPWHGALGRFSKLDRQKVDEAMSLTDVAGWADRLVDSLSGGERQRVWLAMLVAQDAECLLLDEPTSALDIAHQIEILALIRCLSHAKGLAVLLVLHDVNMAARFCDEIVALHTGRMIAHGAPGEILEPEKLENIYGVAMAVMTHPVTGDPIAVAC